MVPRAGASVLRPRLGPVSVYEPPLIAPLRLPLERGLDALVRRFMEHGDLAAVNFAEPRGEPALAEPDSVSWRVFKNPVALFVGGLAAVILELAEPSVRTGILEHTTFRTDPARRLRRTGLAAMVTVYGAQGLAREMIGHIRRAHEAVTGVTPSGRPYRANDPELLSFVQATALHGFATAYSRYVAPLADVELARLYQEGLPAAELYGAEDAPKTPVAFDAMLERFGHRFEPSPFVGELLSTMQRVPAFPMPFRALQPTMVRGAVEITPAWVRERLGLGRECGFRPGEAFLLRRLGASADEIVLASAPPAQACRRLGLPADHLYRRHRAPAPRPASGTLAE